MTSAFSLTEPTAPWIVLAPQDDAFVAQQVVDLEGQGGAVHRMSARELRDPADIFRTFARQLGFPGYFGHNWYALVDCLSDDHVLGHGANGTVVIVEHSDVLLDADFLPIFVAILGEAAERANRRLDADGRRDDETPVQALHLVFLLDSVPPQDFASRLTDPDQMVQRAGPYLLVT